MIPDAPNTKRNRIAALAAVALGLAVGFYLTMSDKDDAPSQESKSSTTDVTASSPQPQPPTPPQTLPAGSLEDIQFSDYSTELAKFVGLEMGETRLDSIDKIRLYFSPEPGTNMVNMTSSTFERDDGSVLLFARNNIPDDSIFAEEVYAVFAGPGEAEKFNQKLAAYGLRLKCRRGDNAMEWTTELCP